MVSSKEIRNIFQQRVIPVLKVKSSATTPYTIKPKTDLYKIDQNAGGYRVSKQIKGSSAESDISERYSAKEMKIYLRGMEEGVLVRTKKSGF